MKNEKPQWAYLVRYIKSKEEVVFKSLGALSRKEGVPRTTLYYNFVLQNCTVYRHKNLLIERLEHFE